MKTALLSVSTLAMASAVAKIGGWNECSGSWDLKITSVNKDNSVPVSAGGNGLIKICAISNKSGGMGGMGGSGSFGGFGSNFLFDFGNFGSGSGMGGMGGSDPFGNPPSGRGQPAPRQGGMGGMGDSDPFGNPSSGRGQPAPRQGGMGGMGDSDPFGNPSSGRGQPAPRQGGMGGMGDSDPFGNPSSGRGQPAPRQGGMGGSDPFGNPSSGNPSSGRGQPAAKKEEVYYADTSSSSFFGKVSIHKFAPKKFEEGKEICDYYRFEVPREAAGKQVKSEFYLGRTKGQFEKGACAQITFDYTK